MKIAICLNGHVRTYKRTVDLLYKNMIDPNKHHDIDIFIHTWHTKDTKISYRNLSNNDFKDDNELTDFDDLKKLYNPKDITIEYFDINRFNIKNYTDKNIVLNDVVNIKKPNSIVASPLTFDCINNVHVATCQTYTFYKSFCNSLNYGPYDCYIKFRFDTKIVKPLILDNFNFKKDVMYGFVWGESPLAQVDFCMGNHNVFKKYAECYLNLKQIYSDINLETIETIFHRHCSVQNIKFEHMEYLGSNDGRDIRVTGYDIVGLYDNV